ncbi:hypothetical protein N7523_005588 [Penicillium sp. IBT 18751x]|nr:hypothetical protein N7523_005825 [Penicillium sp. IBT 18751x]KAJ6117837.1 hypothetical protein N7523_005588 [Penicillium sp. IBT 18751x]
MMELPETQPSPGLGFPSSGFVSWNHRGLEQESTSPSLVSYKHSIAEDVKPTEPLIPGSKTLERLPPEILAHIVSYLALDVPPTGYSLRNVDLISCLLVCRALHAATLNVLYKTMSFSHSATFSKALLHISRYPALGTLVRRLDFSHFTSIGLGRTRQMNTEIQNLTSQTLMLWLDLLPNLRECLLQEHLVGDLSEEVIRKLFTGLPGLRAVDFCGCSTRLFSEAFTQALTSDASLAVILPNLQCLSLHECSTIPAPVLGLLLCRLTRLTHLDLARTQVDDSALLAIPETAQITHLNLSRCSRLRASTLVRFLTTHSAVRDSLVHLNLLADSAPFRLSEDDLATLLPRMPTTMRSLNLGGAKINAKHLPLLVPLIKQLEELGLSSANLSLQEIKSLFTDTAGNGREESITKSTLCYLDLTKVPHVTAMSIVNGNDCLLNDQSWPLQVIELSSEVTGPLCQSSKAQASVGWKVHKSGRRNWYVRDSSSTPSGWVDDGSRPWKLGARWWGMRKVPVVAGEISGLYSHYMFKK